MHAKSDLTGEDETFHFALATDRYKDNRIPPKGFDISAAAARMIQPVWHGVVSPTYFTTAEYPGGHDNINLSDYGITFTNATTVTVGLYY